MCGIVGGVWLGTSLSTSAFSGALDAMEHAAPTGSARSTCGWGSRRAARPDVPRDHQPDQRWPAVDGLRQRPVLDRLQRRDHNFLELRAELAGPGVALHTASDTEVLLAA